MRKKSPLHLSIVFLTTFLAGFCLETHKAQGDIGQAPGFSIARLALPIISSHTETILPTGTPTGMQVAEAKKMLQTLENETSSSVQATRELYDRAMLEVNQYHKIIGEIEAKLQLGTTPANPYLVEMRARALQQLTQITCTLEMMKGLSQGFSNSLQQVKTIGLHVNQAFSLPGAVDEDHAQLMLIVQALVQLEGEIGQVLSIINANIGRQSEWMAKERSRFDGLSIAINQGGARGYEQKSVTSQPLKALNPRKSLKTSPSHKKELSPLPLKATSAKKKALPPPPLLVEKQETLLDLIEDPYTQTPVLPEKEKPLSSSPPQEELSNPIDSLIEYGAAAKGRSPLGVLEAQQDAQSQKWYLFSAAKRGLTSPTDSIDIISVTGQAGSSKKGEKVKDLLIRQGLNPEQLHVIQVTGSPDQQGKIYIFGK